MARRPTEDEINRLEKAAWDAGVDQVLVWIREERDRARAALEAREGTLAMTVDRLEGQVDGRPTSRVNFLQRIDELRAIEARAASPTPWQPIATAPKDGTAFLGYGIHDHSPKDAQRGVKAGDHWWAIILWDIWRGEHSRRLNGSRWCFAKDGAETWSEPTHWMPLPDPPRAAVPEQEK